MNPITHAEQPYYAWLAQALTGLANRRSPADTNWTADGRIQKSLFDTDSANAAFTGPALSENFTSKAKRVACHRDTKRWDVLYRILWRLLAQQEKHLLKLAGDPDVRRFETFHRAVAMDAHRMQGFLRFQDITEGSNGDIELVALYEPDHRVLGWVVPYFRRRLGTTHWAILTPYDSVTCRRGEFEFGPGIRRSVQQDTDDIATLWRRFYQATYNPERTNKPLFDKTLPPRYRKHLTEAPTIDNLTDPQ